MKLPVTRKTILTVFVAAALAIGGFFVGKYLQHRQDLILFDAIHPVREQGTAYSFISPLLGYSIPSDVDLNESQPLLKIVQSVIDSAKRTGEIDNVSVYFRDLTTNHWFGIDQARQYYPASLLKVPIMVAYFQKAETDPNILKHILIVKPLPINQSTELETPSTLTPGRSYSVSQLITSMITESDNGAMATLFSYLVSSSPNALSDIYSNLNVQKPDDTSSAEYQISARAYGWFFRVLYNATYISSAHSEEALNLLSKVTFKDGIVGGVPTDVVVAHKYGEHLNTDGSVVTAVQMHDCGIVYAKPNPYLLCVMTQTKSEAASTKVIQDISRTIYQNISKKR